MPRHTTVALNRRRFSNALIFIYSSLQLILNSLFFISIPLLGQEMWIAHRDNGAGGPEAYFNIYYGSANYVLIGSGAQNISMFLADALLVSIEILY
jgi:hypothetical protein